MEIIVKTHTNSESFNNINDIISSTISRVLFKCGIDSIEPKVYGEKQNKVCHVVAEDRLKAYELIGILHTDFKYVWHTLFDFNNVIRTTVVIMGSPITFVIKSTIH